jgi:uncharacterized protein (TIGR03437 family)
MVNLSINAATQRVDTTLSGVQVLFDGVPAPLVYVSPGQVGAVVPYSVAGKPTTRVSYLFGGQVTSTVTMSVSDAAPALFTADASGRGPAAALNQDGSINSESNPATRGSVVVLYGTGEGRTTPDGIDGKPAADPLPRPLLPVKVRIAGRDVPVTYAGGAPNYTAGAMQVNIFIPHDAPTGNVPVVLSVGDRSSPGNVTVAIR